MRKRKYIDTIVFRIDPRTREKVVEISNQEDKSIADITRALIDEGLKARGMA